MTSNSGAFVQYFQYPRRTSQHPIVMYYCSFLFTSFVVRRTAHYNECHHISNGNWNSNEDHHWTNVLQHQMFGVMAILCRFWAQWCKNNFSGTLRCYFPKKVLRELRFIQVLVPPDSKSLVFVCSDSRVCRLAQALLGWTVGCITGSSASVHYRRPPPLVDALGWSLLPGPLGRYASLPALYRPCSSRPRPRSRRLRWHQPLVNYSKRMNWRSCWCMVLFIVRQLLIILMKYK